MRKPRLKGGMLLSVLIISFCALVQPKPAQERQTPAPVPQGTPPPPITQQQPAETDDLLRVESELVQTAVTVVDKKGEFVGGLRREQFEMLIDGKPQPISFFEQVVAGTGGEQRRPPAARSNSSATVPAETATTTDRGRNVFLFVDDVHLSSSSLAHARKTLLHYIDSVMGLNDQAAVASTSGRVGFLQQLTDNKAVLRAAVARITYRHRSTNFTGNPPITPYQAIAVEERNDGEIFEYLIRETLRITPGLPRSVAESLVKSRTRVIARESAIANKATLSSLENLLRTSTRLPGRKVVLFFSDGFLLQLTNSDEVEQLRRITDAAARADAVVYTVDSGGLATDPQFDASSGRPGDPSGMLLRHSTSELRAQQEPLITIAEETGGRAIVNTNDLVGGVSRVLDESSRYYLLAWQPEHDENRGGKFRRIEVAVVGRPDLTVRLHKGYLVAEARPAPKKDKPATPPPAQDELGAALSAVYPSRQLPVSLVVNFLDIQDRGAVLTASAGVPSYSLTFKTSGDKQTANVDMACAVYNDQGKPAASAQQRLEVSGVDAEGTSLPQRDIAYNFQFNKLPPGLYQVRAAARDGESGYVGSTSQWIEIPDLKKGKLSLSSLLVGGVPDGEQGVKGDRAVPDRLNFDVARKFPRTSRLGFYTFIYNASRGAGGRAAPDLLVRVQVWNSDRAIIDSGERRVVTDGAADPERLPYGANLDLSSLPAGRYLLQVTVTDRHTKESAAQSTRFEVR